MTGELASHRIYVDAEGQVVDETDPSAAFLAVAAGHEIPDHIAEQLEPPETQPEPPKKSGKRKTSSKKAPDAGGAAEGGE